MNTSCYWTREQSIEGKSILTSKIAALETNDKVNNQSMYAGSSQLHPPDS
jgi:hypothetical protein